MFVLTLLLMVTISMAIGGRMLSNDILRAIQCNSHKNEAAKKRLSAVFKKAEIVAYMGGLLSVTIVTFLIFI